MSEILLSSVFKDKSVSIVGNASSLLEYSYGQEIDDHDVVVRINRGAFYEKDFVDSLGSKFNVWCIQNALGQRKRLYDKSIRYIKKIQMDTLEVSEKRLHLVDEVYKTKFYNELVFKANLEKKPSTGLKVIDYVLRTEPKLISLYGFDFKKSSTWYDTRTVISLPHDFDGEKKYVEGLLEKHKNMRLVKI